MLTAPAGGDAGAGLVADPLPELHAAAAKVTATATASPGTAFTA
jgi:hypothetical protein